MIRSRHSGKGADQRCRLVLGVHDAHDVRRVFDIAVDDGELLLRELGRDFNHRIGEQVADTDDQIVLPRTRKIAEVRTVVRSRGALELDPLQAELRCCCFGTEEPHVVERQVTSPAYIENDSELPFSQSDRGYDHHTQQCNGNQAEKFLQSTPPLLLAEPKRSGAGSCRTVRPIIPRKHSTGRRQPAPSPERIEFLDAILRYDMESSKERSP